MSDVGDYGGRPAVFGLAREFEADAIGSKSKSRIVPEAAGPGRYKLIPNDLSRASSWWNRLAVTTKAQCHMVPMVLWLQVGFSPFRDLEERKEAVIAHMEEVVAYLLVRVAIVGGASAETRAPS